MNWEIVVGIIALVGFVGSISTWVSKMTKSLAMLESTIEMLDGTLQEMSEHNREGHKEFYRRLDNHEGRISKLEYDRDDRTVK